MCLSPSLPTGLGGGDAGHVPRGRLVAFCRARRQVSICWLNDRLFQLKQFQ